MSNARYASVFAFAAALIAAGCSGITIDVAGNSCDDSATAADVSVDNRYHMAKPVFAGTVILNESKDSVTFVMKTLGGCEKHGDEFVWNAAFYYGDTSTFGYRFSEDTLFLSTESLVEKGFEDPEEMLVEYILIGEHNDGLDGVWFITPCLFFDGNLRCSEYGYEEFLLIDGNDVEKRTLDRTGFNYMESVFIDELFSYIGSRSSALQLETVFYGMETEYTANRYGIDVTAKSKTAMTFTYADIEFDVALTHTSYRDSVQVIVKSGKIECIGTHREYAEMSSEECRADYADDLREESFGAWTYWSQNSDEFARCIDGILGREN